MPSLLRGQGSEPDRRQMRWRKQNAVTAESATRDLVVLETHRPPRPVARYVDQVVGSSASRGITYRYASTPVRRLNMDVIHLHPGQSSTILGAHRGGVRRLVSSVVFVSRLRWRRIALVQTLDRPAPQWSAGKCEFLIRLILDHATSTFIVLHEDAATPDPERTTMITHADYTDRYVGYPRGNQVHGRLLCCSSEGLHAASSDLLAAFKVAATPALTLRFVGPASRALESRLQEGALRYAGVSTHLGVVSDGLLITEIDRAELVLLPRLETLGDMHIALLALSRGRAIAVPTSTAARHLARDVGVDWVTLCASVPSANDIDAAIAVARGRRADSSPDLSGREMESTAAAYARVFHASATATRARRRPVYLKP